MLILPKFWIVCGVKLKPLVTSQASVTVAPLPVGTLCTTALHVVSRVRLMSLVTLVFANDWLNRLKNPNRTCSFWSAIVEKFLNTVRSVFVRVGVRMLYFGTLLAFCPNAGNEKHL